MFQAIFKTYIDEMQKKYSHCEMWDVCYYKVHTLQVIETNLSNSKHSLVNNFSNAQGELNTKS